MRSRRLPARIRVAHRPDLGGCWWIQTAHTATGAPLEECLCPHFESLRAAHDWTAARDRDDAMHALREHWARAGAATVRDLHRSTGIPLGRLRAALRQLAANSLAESTRIVFGSLRWAPAWRPCASERARMARERATGAEESSHA